MAQAAEKKKTSFAKDMVAGGAAGCLEVTIMYPTEYVKTQLQLQPKNQRLYSGMVDCAVGEARSLPCFVAPGAPSPTTLWRRPGHQRPP